jgi:hypothetical protein
MGLQFSEKCSYSTQAEERCTEKRKSHRNREAETGGTRNHGKLTAPRRDRMDSNSPEASESNTTLMLDF